MIFFFYVRDLNLVRFFMPVFYEELRLSQTRTDWTDPFDFLRHYYKTFT